MALTTQDPALARLIEQLNDARTRRVPVAIMGGGTKAFYGQAVQGTALDVKPLRGISQYEPSELVITARAGTPLAELEAALAERGQCLPFEPPHFAAGGTVGGMVAAGLAGPARVAVGTVRDYVLGATVLNGRGELLSFGGQVMKNVAGYDMARSFAGSLGVLGVICEVSLKVLPLPAARRTVVFECAQADALAQLARWASQPLPIQASAWHAGRLSVRLAGAHAAVEAAQVQFIAQGAQALPDEEADAWWRSVRDQQHRFFALDVFQRAEGWRLWRLSVPRTAPPLAGDEDTFIEWHGAQRWLRSQRPASALRDAAQRVGGHATLMCGGDGHEPVFTRPEPALWRIHQTLKRAFDPQGVFNPGRLYPDL
ncbi:MAG: hypothetical protein RLZZ494_468 [Pseudomonadota bacterium]